MSSHGRNSKNNSSDCAASNEDKAARRQQQPEPPLKDEAQFRTHSCEDKSQRFQIPKYVGSRSQKPQSTLFLGLHATMMRYVDPWGLKTHELARRHSEVPGLLHLELASALRMIVIIATLLTHPLPIFVPRSPTEPCVYQPLVATRRTPRGPSDSGSSRFAGGQVYLAPFSPCGEREASAPAMPRERESNVETWRITNVVIPCLERSYGIRYLCEHTGRGHIQVGT